MDTTLVRIKGLLPGQLGVSRTAEIVDAAQEYCREHGVTMVKLSDGRQVFLKPNEFDVVRSISGIMDEFTANSPRRITGSEIDGWCGLEGEGFIAETGHDETIVMDVTEDAITLQVFDPDMEMELSVTFKREGR